MKLHTLKTDPEVFQLSLDGKKDYEIRYNDRDFQVGDLLELKETKYSAEEMAAGASLEYTGRTLDQEITHVLSGYNLPEGMVILSVKPALVFRDNAADIEARLQCTDHEHDVSTDTETLVSALEIIAMDLPEEQFTEQSALLDAARRLEEQHQQLSEATELAEHLALENEQLKKDLAKSQKWRRFNAERLQTYHAHCSELKCEVALQQQRADALEVENEQQANRILALIAQNERLTRELDSLTVDAIKPLCIEFLDCWDNAPPGYDADRCFDDWWKEEGRSLLVQRLTEETAA